MMSGRISWYLAKLWRKRYIHFEDKGWCEQMETPRRKQKNSYRQHMSGRVVDLKEVRTRKRMDERKHTQRLRRPRVAIVMVYSFSLLCLIAAGTLAVAGFFPIDWRGSAIFLSISISLLGFVSHLALFSLRKMPGRLVPLQSLVLLLGYISGMVFLYGR